MQSSTEPGEFSVLAACPSLAPDRITIDAVGPKPVDVAVVADPVIRLGGGGSRPVVTAEIRDRFGTTVPTAENAVTFKIAGRATFENGSKAITIQAEKGKAVAHITTGEKRGEVQISAHADGLVPAKVRIIVQ